MQQSWPKEEGQLVHCLNFKSSISCLIPNYSVSKSSVRPGRKISKDLTTEYLPSTVA
jgi:hypothetical protein